MDPLFPEIPEDFADLDDEALAQFIAAAEEIVEAVTANTADYVGEGRTKDELVAEFGEGIQALKAARVERASRAETEGGEGDEGGEGGGDESSDEDLSATVAQLAAEAEEDADASGDESEGDAADAGSEGADDADAGEGAGEDEGGSVTASAPPTKRKLRRPARSAASTPQDNRELIAMTAAAGNTGIAEIGDPVDEIDVARMTIKKREQFGRIAPGTKGDKVPIASFDYKDRYSEDRRLRGDISDQDKIDAVQDQTVIRRNFEQRREAAGDGALLASGGLCNPETPYYNLQMVSVPDRPVRAALPAFNADRGGINAAQPLTLADITTAVGVKTEAQDAAGGSAADKTCQVIDCPDFVATDVNMVYHCVQFGNLGARAYPERVAQANSLVLAAHARTAESQLLTNIQALSTNVTAATIGLGAAASLLGEILVAAAGMRSRHRMSADAVLRAILPRWILDMLVSDTYRTQFQRFDMTPERFVALIRAGNVEPSFYIDGAAGNQQVFGAQPDGALLPFPDNAVWYLFPEGSFLYLDAGTLELGIVRDSVLNATNDFQIFGETFENVAFVGVEALSVSSALCDSGTVTLPVALPCPLNYS